MLTKAKRIFETLFSSKSRFQGKGALKKAKQRAFLHTNRGQANDLGLDFLDPFKRLLDLQQQYRQHLPSDQRGIRIIGGDWLVNIGQIAHLDKYFKLKALGMVEPSETVICLDGLKPANHALLSYFAPFASSIVPNREALGEVGKLVELLEESTVTVRLVDGRAVHYHALFYDVDAAWQQQGRPPLVSIRPEHQADGQRWLSSLGMPDDGWFVTFHCRTGTHQGLRSVKPETYTRAIEAVLRSGGWVVCLGFHCQSTHPKIINRDDHRIPDDDWKDIFLIASCRFFVACTSGPCDVANAFRVPMVKVNLVQLGSQAAYNADLFIPKLFQSRWLGRPLTIAEILEQVGTACGWDISQLDVLGLDAIDNTPEEIEAVVCEMIERLNGLGRDPTPEEEIAQQRLREFRQNAAIGHGPIVAGKSRMGRDFLCNHASALGLSDA